jgi:site-specific recombinase XerD
MSYSIERYADDLALAGKAARTVATYCDNVRRFERWAERPANEVGEAEVRGFLLHLLQERRVASRTYLTYMAALIFLYRHALGRPEVVAALVRPKMPKTQIVVPTVAEVRALIECAPTPFARVMFETAYGCGLRASEVCALRAEDIDSKYRLVHVRHGKGDKQRAVMLGDRLLAVLRDHWRLYRLPGPWLFPRHVRGARSWSNEPVDAVWLGRRFATARSRSNVRRKITLHGLRHGFASHLLEAGTDTAVLRVLMGHQDIATTVHYAHVRTDLLRTTPSPLDLLYRS